MRLIRMRTCLTQPVSCTHLEETQRVEVLAHIVDDLAAGDEDVPDIVVQHQVEVALPVARLDVGEAAVGRLGQHVQARCEQEHLGGRDGKLALLGARGDAGHADNVAAAEDAVRGVKVVGRLGVPAGPSSGSACQLWVLKLCKPHALHLRHDLHLLPLGMQVEEAQVGARRAHVAHAPCKRHDLAALDLLPHRNLALGPVFFDIVRNGERHVELVRVRVGLLRLAQRENLLASELVVLLWARTVSARRPDSAERIKQRASPRTLDVSASSSTSSSPPGALSFFSTGALSAFSAFLAAFFASDSRCFSRRLSSLCRVVCELEHSPSTQERFTHDLEIISPVTGSLCEPASVPVDMA